jgi:2,3-bisphosphoglycerate-dependent phosphoglycerate mutase
VSVRALVMVRHGQSVANAAGAFTGWADVPLTADGALQARHAGVLLRESGWLPGALHTSVLRRSTVTAEIITEVLGRCWLPVGRSWRLNERQYGAWAGRRKTEVRGEVGEERYRLVRRSLSAAPPASAPGELAALRADARYAGLAADLVPARESLADVIARVVPYWADVLAPQVSAGRIPLVVAHGNSLRALAAHLDRLGEAQVARLNIPTGIPLVYEFDDRLRPRRPGGRYLDPHAAAKAAAAVAREGHGP